MKENDKIVWRDDVGILYRGVILCEANSEEFDWVVKLSVRHPITGLIAYSNIEVYQSELSIDQDANTTLKEML